MARRASRTARRAAALVAAVTGTVALAGCFTGQRPTLAEGAAMSGDPAVDAVLQRLDATRAGVFTVGYDVLTRFGDKHTAVTVVQAGPARRVVTVGAVRLIIDGPETATCDTVTSTCSDTIDAARISDTQLAPDFFATGAAIRLRRDAAARIAPPVGSTETIAGQQATCVAVPVTGATETYCALDGGPLARLDAADLRIDLTSWTATADEGQFESS